MTIFYRLFYKLTVRDYNKIIQSAKITNKMIIDSTYGKPAHFYNSSGIKIRGFHKHIKFTNISQHPLIQQYK